jgi:hypothetical protein
MIAAIFVLLMGAPATSSEAEEVAVYTITMDYKITNHGPGRAENARMTLYLFDNIFGWAQQTVLDESFEGVSAFLSEIRSTADNRWVRVSVGDLREGESKTLRVIQTLKVKAVDFSIDPDLVDNFFPQELLDAFTSPVDGLWESDHPWIQNLARRLTDNTDNPYYKVKQIFDFVVEEEDEQDLVYQPLGEDHGALWALQHGVGDCAEFSNLFVALVRAIGIPAKVVSGFAYKPTGPLTENIDPMGHAYAIFYLPKKGEDYGWIPVDAVWPRYSGSFGRMDYFHIAGATTGGEGVVKDGIIEWPGPGSVENPYVTIYEKGTDVFFAPGTGTITPEILLEVDLQTASVIKENGSWTITVTTTNKGRSTASDLEVELDVNPDFFDVITGPQQKNTLTHGTRWTTTFDVMVQENAYGKEHSLVAKVTFSSTYDEITGTFSTREELLKSIAEKPELQLPSLPEFLLDPVIFILLICLVAVIGALGAVIVRR